MNRVTTVSRTRWAAFGAALVVAIGGGAFAFVDAGGGTASDFVPISPCRLLDTRSTSPVGPRTTPITAGESLTVQVTGSNGSCVIPASATAIVINVTAVSPSAAGYITLFPADVALPNASNLNFTAGQSPTPNLVTVSLSAGGAVKIFNAAGTVNVLGDIAGYYQPDAGAGNAGSACTADGFPGVVVNGYDHEHNVSTKCFTGLVTTLAGSGVAASTDGVGIQAAFYNPVAVAVDSVGNIYVVDQDSHRIRKITVTGVVTTLAGSVLGNADGLGAAARFRAPSGLAVDSVGNVYVADTGNQDIRKITPAGEVTTFTGSGVQGFLDGAPGFAQFDDPAGLAVDASDNIYVADFGNNRIRKITPGGTVSTVAGDGTAGTTDGAAGVARFFHPNAVAVDGSGNVYVADLGNNRIRKITMAGVVSTLAGSTTGFANGTGVAAQFFDPAGVAVDSSGNVYVADLGNNRIRRVTPAGVVTTLAGDGTQGYIEGAGAAAQFNKPLAIAIDAAGTLYVVDSNRVIRRIK